VQTTQVETTSPAAYEEEIRQRILKEQDVEAERLARDKELEEESVKLEKEIEREIRGKDTAVFLFQREAHGCRISELSEEERSSILAAPEFLDFVEQSSKIVQRALNDGYDYIRDYTIGTESGVYVLCSRFYVGKFQSYVLGTILKVSASNEFANSGTSAMGRIGRSLM